MVKDGFSERPQYIKKGNTVFIIKTVYSGSKTAKELMIKAILNMAKEQHNEQTA